MGYRSEVAFSITVDDYHPDSTERRDTFKKLVGMFKLSEFYAHVTQPDYDCIHSNELGWSWREGQIVFYVQSWKWYDSFPVVEKYHQMWAMFINLAEKEDFPISGRFIRSGEELEDVQYDEFGNEPDYDMGYVNKTFDFEHNNLLGVMDSEEGTNAEVQADTQQHAEGRHNCGQDADQEREAANTAAHG